MGDVGKTTTSSVTVGEVEAVKAAWCECLERFGETETTKHPSGNTNICNRCGRILRGRLPDDDPQAGKEVEANMARYAVGIPRPKRET